ncbi:sensor histidine kinase [Altererythrobacter sp. MF3-039]|uniref:sensor histidine kinase n=1 Tax=Altererythrobacter sp. MF3-039 TaxID=3252901 RepID=UPI00390C418F
MAVLPFQPTPFFANKNRAFWNLQLAGWLSVFVFRAVSGFAGGQELSFFVIILIEAITGFSVTLVLSTIYGKLITRRPLVTWGMTAIVLAIAVLVIASINAWVLSLTRPDSEASFTALLIGYMIFPMTLLGAWSALYYAINFFLQVEEQTDRMERLEAQATSAQLAMLRYQLNPHFLFNTLNSISTLVLLRQTEPANAMLTRLSSFLRHTLVSQPGSKVTVAQEVETLMLYLDIERMRFEERLRTEFRIDPDVRNACLPAMLLQPLVENAIKYAVSAQEEGAQISLSAQLVGNRLRVAVSDTGPGLPQPGEPLTLLAAMPGGGKAVSTGVGLANIRDRLAQAYGDEHKFEIRNPPEGGFTVIIEIPFEESEEAARAEAAISQQPHRNPQPALAEASQLANGTNA